MTNLTRNWYRVKDVVGGFPLATKVHIAGFMAISKLRQENLLARYGGSVDLTLLGSTLRLDLNEMHDVLVFESIRRTGFWERATSLALLDHLRSGDLFVDVGANNGYFSILAASRTGPDGRVLAVEPNPSAADRLAENVRINMLESRVRVLRLAAGDQRATGILYRSAFEDGWASQVAPSADPIPVETDRLDAHIPSAKRMTIKIDTEGRELEVIRGLGRTISDTPELALVVEWTRNRSSEALWRELSADFCVSRILEGGDGTRMARVSRYSDLRMVNLSNLWCEKIA